MNLSLQTFIHHKILMDSLEIIWQIFLNNLKDYPRFQLGDKFVSQLFNIAKSLNLVLHKKIVKQERNPKSWEQTKIGQEKGTETCNAASSTKYRQKKGEDSSPHLKTSIFFFSSLLLRRKTSSANSSEGTNHLLLPEKQLSKLPVYCTKREPMKSLRFSAQPNSKILYLR